MPAFLAAPPLPRRARARARPRAPAPTVVAAAAAPAPARVAILGASGYTGAELLRLLAAHPRTRVAALTADRSAGKPIGAVYAQYAFGAFAESLPPLVTNDAVDWAAIDLAFCCLPHATTQTLVASLPLRDGLRVVDLSADFRLRDVETYERWYGAPHAAEPLQREAVYGLTELARHAVRDARLVANPGCYPTAAQLPLIPLLRARLVAPADIVIDAKSGTSGAGRSPKVATLFCEVADGISAYGVASHRHTPEIEQGLSDAAGEPVRVTFTPHLMPMSRGILETIYVRLGDGTTAADLRQCLNDTYAAEPFVHVVPEGGAPPQTRHVRGTNNCVISVVDDAIPGRAIIVSVIDNVVKGASGQAVQNMNVMLGFPEAMGLELQASFP